MKTITVRVKSVHSWGYVLFEINGGGRIDLTFEHADELREQCRIPRNKFRKGSMFVIVGDES